jgi:hypothetical protein
MPRKSSSGSSVNGIALSTEKALEQASHSNHANFDNGLPVLNTLNKEKRNKEFNELKKQKNGQQDLNNLKKSGYLVSWNPLSKWPTIILIVILLIIIIAAIVIPIILLKPKSEEKVPDQSEQSRRSGQEGIASIPTLGPASSQTQAQSEVETSVDNSNITRVLFFTLEKLVASGDKLKLYEKEGKFNKRILINNINDIYNINNKIINLVTPVNAKEAIITGIKIKNCKIILTRWPNSQKETKEYVQYMKDKPDDWLDIPFDINFPYYQTAVISIMSEILLFDINGYVIKDERIFEKDIIKEITFSIPFTSFKIRNCKVIVKQPYQIEESFVHRSNEDDTKDIKNDSKCYLKKSFTNTENNNYKTIIIIPFK